MECLIGSLGLNPGFGFDIFVITTSRMYGVRDGGGNIAERRLRGLDFGALGVVLVSRLVMRALRWRGNKIN